MIFETHAHYDDEAFDADRDALLESLPAAGIGRVCNIGASLKGSIKSAELAEKYGFVYFAAGIHPDECADLDDDAGFRKIRELAMHPKCVAIGEIGLDYHGFDIYEDKPSKERQQECFLMQLELAAGLGKAVVIHSRNASADTLEYMKKARAMGIERAILHCYSYSRETALEYVSMGYMLGFGGSTTYEGQKKLSKVLGAVPAEHIVLETDCPYLAPVPHRGERNSSLNLPLIRDKIAELKGMDPAELEAITFRNALRVYGIEA